MSDEQQQQRQLVGPGELLRAAREKQGLTQENVAEKLRLRVQIIQDIESDNFETDVAATFSRGYIKLYAKMLGLNDQEILQAYYQTNTQEIEPVKLQSFSQRVARQASDQRLMLITYLVGVIVIALLVSWWWQQSVSNGEPLSLQEAAESVAESRPQLNTPSNPPADAAVAEGSQTATERGEAQVSSAAAAVAEDGAIATGNHGDVSRASTLPPAGQVATASPAAQLPQRQRQASQSQTQSSLQVGVAAAGDVSGVEQRAVDSDDGNSTTDDTIPALNTANNDQEQILADPVALEFTFAEACWIQIVDARGEEIAVGVKAKGRVMPVTGIPPFEVTLGAPQFVAIKYAGEPIPMPPYNRGAIAKFSLPHSQ